MKRTLILSLTLLLFFAADLYGQNSALDAALPKTVKLYGPGGLAGFDDNQSGIIISDKGHILTVSSALLDEPPISCTLNNGQKFKAVLIGIDPHLEIAVLKIDTATPDYFDLSKPENAVSVGDSVLALSNLYSAATGNEPFSVQHGVISAVTELQARRGAFIAGYRGKIYLIDAITNNPGAPGGVLVNYNGDFLGLLGKQLKSSRQEVWINYALPQAVVAQAADKIINPKKHQEDADSEISKPTDFWTPAKAGIRLTANILPVTPAFIDSIIENSPASKAALLPDDYIIAVNGKIVRDINQLTQALELIDIADPVELLVQRGGEFITVKISGQ